MSTPRPVLAWLVAILTLIAYLTGGAFMVQGFTPLAFLGEHVADIAILVFAVATVFACLLALFAMNREPAPERPAIIRLPRSKTSRWALGFAVVFYPAVLLFTGNTLFDLMRALGLSEEVFQAVFRVVGGLGLWLVVASAVGALVMALVALIKNKDRALVLGLPLLPALLVFGFILGEVLSPH